MNFVLTKPQLKKLKSYLKDEKENHPSIWKAITQAEKSGAHLPQFSATVKEKNLIQKILSVKNPLSARTLRLRDSGLLKPHEWIGGNEFFHPKPKVNKYLEREKHGQLRMELNPKKKKKKNPLKKHLVKGSKAAKDFMAKLRAKKKK